MLLRPTFSFHSIPSTLLYQFRCVRIVAKIAYYIRHVLSSVCMSIFPHVSAHLPLDEFPLNFILEAFTKICRETINLVQIG